MNKNKTHEQHNIPDNEVVLEDYLKDNGFQIENYYHTNKRFSKEITDYQTLYVRIYTDVNTLQEVEYEHRAMTRFERDCKISFETIDTIPKLKLLLEALL